MQEKVSVTGIILKQSPVREYDRVITILTKERGKITAFVNGARKPGSKQSAMANPFSYGTFKLYEGKNAYTVVEADIGNYFENLRMDYEKACYGAYFSEITDYYTRENNDEIRMMKLLYQSLRALSCESIPKELVKCIFEIKSIEINGEFPGIPNNLKYETTAYTIDYIVNSPEEKLFGFTVKQEILEELTVVSEKYCEKNIDTKMKSLSILKSLC